MASTHTGAAQGALKMKWAEAHMPVLAAIAEEYAPSQPLSGLRVGMCIHLEAKTAVLSTLLARLGADVTITGSNPLSTQDDVAAALAEHVTVVARHGVDDEQYHRFVRQVLQAGPHLILDDGGDLVTESVRAGAEGILGATEETTTGLVRLRQLEREGKLPFPVIAVNDTPMKRLFDNRHGTGQSVLSAIMNVTNLSLAGKCVVVVGFGYCGKGVALRAEGLGARVAVVEIDPVKANEAWLEGYDVLTMDEAARIGDVFVTVTGNRSVIRGRHFDRMKDGAILSNAGHFDVEVDKADLLERAKSSRQVRPGVEGFSLEEGRTLYLLADGRLVNLAAGDGHPVEIMDLSFGLQALSLMHLAKERPPQRAVLAVPDAVDEKVARLSVAARGLGLEELTEEQKRYMRSWETGT